MSISFEWGSEYLGKRMRAELRKLDVWGYDFEEYPEEMQVKVIIPSRQNMSLVFTVGEHYPFRPPKVELEGASITHIGITGGRLDMSRWSPSILFLATVAEIATAFETFHDSDTKWREISSDEEKTSWMFDALDVGGFAIRFDERQTMVKSASKC